MTFDKLVKIVGKRWGDLTIEDHKKAFTEVYNIKHGKCTIIQDRIDQVVTMIIASAGIAWYNYTTGIAYFAKALTKDKLPIIYVWDALEARINKGEQK